MAAPLLTVALILALWLVADIFFVLIFWRRLLNFLAPESWPVLDGDDKEDMAA